MSPVDDMPPNTLRRATSVHSVLTHILRSRWGSTALFNLIAHSLYRFGGSRFAGVGTQLYRDGSSIKTGLGGGRLAFVRMPPQIGLVDYLFVAGGGTLVKSTAAGVVTGWGIAAPAGDFTAAAGAAGVPNGTYKYAVTFRNSTTGSRSNGNPNVQTIALANQKGALSGLPTSSDAQVDQREIWRSVAGGTVLFRLDRINDNTTTTYTDNAADSALASEQLPTDNAPPTANYGDAAGPHFGRVFWAQNPNAGFRGRVGYSASGRPESDVGFIDITNDDDPTQKVIVWAGSVWCFTQSKLFQILGTTEPFIYREVQGAPGTSNPYTVKATPFGLVYQATGDALYLFNGVTASPLAFDACGLLFRGESLEGITAMSGIAADYGKAEYLISDGVNTLAYNLIRGTTRNVGIGMNAIYFEPDTRKFQVALSTTVATFDDPGVTTDSGAAISFEVETAGMRTDVRKSGVFQRLFLDIDTSGEWLTPAIIIDGTTYTLPQGQVQTSGRTSVELEVGQKFRVASIRLTGTLSNQVKIYGIEADVDVGGDLIVPAWVAGRQEGVVTSVAQSV